MNVFDYEDIELSMQFIFKKNLCTLMTAHLYQVRQPLAIDLTNRLHWLLDRRGQP